VEAVKRVTKTVCPLKIVLDRVVLTSTGSSWPVAGLDL